MSATIGHEENQYLTMAAAAGPVPSANRQRLGTPSGHRGRRPGSGASSGTDYIATLIEELQISVAEGDLEKSTAAVRQLVAHRTSLSIALNTSPPSTDPRYQEITVKIHVEDKETTAPPFFWTLKTNTTVLQLKRKMLTEHGFPMQVQRWIIGRRIAKDDDTLYRCGVTADGTSIFLYLISAASIGLVKQEFLADNKKPLPSGTLDDTIEENIYMSIHRTDSVGLRDSVADNLTGVPSPSPDASKSEHPPPLPPRNQPELDQLDNPNDLGDRPNKPPAPDVQYHQSASSQRALLTAENIPPPAPAEGYQDVPGILQQPETTSIAPQAGWQCPLCTFVNEPTRPGCEACTSPRPDDYVVPDHYEMSEREKERIRNERELDKLSEQARSESRQDNFRRLLEADQMNLLPNPDEFECPICFDLVEETEGIMLRDCLHCFCRECLSQHIKTCNDANIVCPYAADGEESCTASLQDREIKALVPEPAFQHYLDRSVQIAENQATNSYHCKTINCPGWCLYDDQVNFFDCPICQMKNCLTCKAIHQGQNCKDYQDELQAKAANDTAARQTQLILQGMVDQGEAMHCPSCDIVLMKKDGCDWLKCSMCKTEICWVTRGFRWGQQGSGDTSGGCKCRVNNKLCHPKCQNCH